MYVKYDYQVNASHHQNGLAAACVGEEQYATESIAWSIQKQISQTTQHCDVTGSSLLTNARCCCAMAENHFRR